MPAQEISLLTTKLHNPLPRPIQHLDKGLRRGHRLTLVSAPPGFGKTTLVSDWVYLYGKLGVHSWTQAVARARNLGLL
jgi:ATP/maltotriose-dependent transcriptional regulator MalT